jgi:hypothetical protein
MLEQLNVYIKNTFQGAWEGNIQVFRELPDGTRDMNITIAPDEEANILLPEPGVFLIITPPSQADITTSPFMVTKHEELVIWETIDDYWKVQMAEVEAPPEVPTDVNINVGGPPPTP